MQQYKLYSKNNDGLIDSVLSISENGVMWIPFDDQNSDYRSYLFWLEQGNAPIPLDQ